jgi:leucyl aminopeptidase
MKKYVFLALIILQLSKSFSQEGMKLEVTSSELKEWISYLASDEMRGRSNGSQEMKNAADWIVQKFRENDVIPVTPGGSLIQNYSFIYRQQTISERNVIGIINGTDPSLKDQYIVLSAHFDHIGIRKGLKPDSICNGADDNASGVCTLIGIAKSIKQSKKKPGRTIVLAAFSGEEAGMRGSRFFISNPSVPLRNVYADLNFEMTGHSEYLGKNKYYMTGCLISNLDDIIESYKGETDFQLVDTISIANRLFYSSDNIAFSRISVSDDITQGIPSGTFATSAITDYLHGVNDEAELFDFDNMANLVSYFSSLVIWLSNNKTEIEFSDPKFLRIK